MSANQQIKFVRPSRTGAICLALVICFLSIGSQSFAYDSRAEPGSSVSALTRADKHFESLTVFSTIPDSARTIADKLSAAQSSWALGMVGEARLLWDEVLRDQQFRGPERDRATLSRAILEVQERNYDEARAIAERATLGMENSDLKAQLLLVIAESLRKQGAITQAEQYYLNAAKIGGEQSKDEAQFLLGENRLALGLIKEARVNFAAVTPGSKYAADSLKRLIEIDFQQRNFDGVLTWIDEGRLGYPTVLEDPKVHYIHISSLVAVKQAQRAQQELEVFKRRYGQNDSWYQLAHAAVMSQEIQDLIPRARLASE